MPFEPSDLFFYFTALSILLSCYFIFSLYLIRKYLNINKDSEKKDYLPFTYAIAFIFFGVGRILMSIFDLIVEFQPSNRTLENIVIWEIGTIFQILGYGLFFILMEKRVMKGRDKYILVILYFVFYFIGILLINTQMDTLFFTIALLLTIYIPFAYLYIAIKADGVVRKKGITIFFGFLVLGIGLALLTETPLMIISSEFGLDYIQIHGISNLIKSVGVCLLFIGYK